MKRISAIFLCFLMLASLVSCSKGEAEKDTSTEFYKTDAETYVIENSFCDLQYPTKWKDYVSTNIVEDETSCKVTFAAMFGAQSIDLFSVTIADTGDGYLLGSLKTNKGSKNVFLEDLFDKKKTADLPKDELNRYYAMSEDVNVVISKLVYDNGMTLSK